jgi:hypothetical protein
MKEMKNQTKKITITTDDATKEEEVEEVEENKSQEKSGRHTTFL